MERLTGSTRHYDWGCPEAIPQLLGMAPDGAPWAEHWLGAHPDGPALLPDGTSLARAAQADLGWADGPWPHLFKLLAARRPLSIQVHPNRQQARAGWIAQNGAAGAIVDPYPKPEMLVALRPTAALAGWAGEEQADEVISICQLDAEPAEPPEPAERPVGPPGPPGPRAARAARTVLTDQRAGQRAHTRLAERLDRGRISRRLHHLTEIRRHHPNDPGLVIAALMDLHRLEPDTALFVPETAIHAYLSGVGVEVMGPSNNVFRAGLTSKPVDPQAVLRIADLTGSCPPHLLERSAADGRGGQLRWSPPGVRWQLSRYLVDGTSPLEDGASILWCQHGELVVQDTKGAVTLRAGHSAAARSDASDRRASGTGMLWQLATATAGRESRATDAT